MRYVHFRRGVIHRFSFLSCQDVIVSESFERVLFLLGPEINPQGPVVAVITLYDRAIILGADLRLSKIYLS